MQVKKSSSVNLEKKISTHLQVSLLLALSIVLVSLEWATPEESMDTPVNASLMTNADIELMPLIPRNKKEKIIQPQLKIPVPVDDNIPEDIFDMKDLFDPEAIDQPYNFRFPEGLDEPEEINTPFDQWAVQIMAKFPGGEEAMMKWIYSQIQYPRECVDNGVEGKVVVKFTISKFGKVQDIEIIQSAHPELDKEVVRVLKQMPEFSPAIQNQQLVPVYMYWPIMFKLN